MTYVFVCDECGYRVEQSVAHPSPTCTHPSEGFETKSRIFRFSASPTSSSRTMRRDYRAESATPLVENLKRARSDAVARTDS